MRKLLICLLPLLVSFISIAQPSIDDATWNDTDGDGNIDQVVLTFDVSVNIIDGNAATDGFPAIAVDDGAAVTLDNQDVSASGVTTLTLNFTGDPITGTDVAGLTVTYSDAGGGDPAIIDPSGPTEMLNGTTATLTTDAAIPVITDATWNDQNGNGNIDQVVLTFSESVDVTDGSAGDGFGAIVVDDGAAVTLDNADYGATGVTGLTLNFTGDEIAGSAIAVLSVTYDNSGANAISDGVPNEIVNGDVAEAYTDNATPAITDATWSDQTGDGNIDRVVLTFSENIDASDGNAGDGFDGIVVDDGAAVTLDFADYAVTNSATLTLNFTGDQIAGTSIGSLSVAYNQAGTNNITSNADSDELADAINALAYTDAAIPVITDATWNDQNGNGNIDQVVLTFSESVDVTDGSAGDGFGAIVVDDGAAVTLDNADYGATGVTGLTLNFTGDEIAGSAIAGLSVTYDNSGANAIADGVPNEIANADIAEAYTDGAAPVILDATWSDQTGDGNIDRVVLTLSELVDIIDGGGAGDGFAAISVDDGAAVTLDNQNVAINDVTTLTLDFTSDQIAGTSIAGLTVAYADQAGDPAIVDNNGVEVVNADQAEAYTDAAPLVISNATWNDQDGNGNIDQVVLNFSEIVDIIDGGGAADGFAAIAVNDGVAVTLDNQDATANDVTTLTLNFLGDEIIGTDIVGLTATYADQAGDPAITDQTPTEITNGTTPFAYIDGAAPVILDATWSDQTGDGNIDRVVLTLSELVDIIDGGGAGDGFAAISVDDGAAVTLDNQNVAINDVTTLTLDFTSDQIAGTSIAGLTVAYADQAGDPAIVDNNGVEVVNADQAEAYTDAAPLVISNATWNDQDGNGNIDQVVLNFSEIVDIIDGGGAADGFAAIAVNDGVAVTLDNQDATANDVTTLTLNFLGDEIIGTDIVGLTATYADQAGDPAITDQTPTEITNGTTPFAYIDGAAPVILDATWSDQDINGNIDRVTLTFSEQVDITDGGGAGDAFSAIAVNDGAAITLDNQDVTASNVTTIFIDFSGDQITGTNIIGLSVTYSDAGGGDPAIIDNNGVETVNGDVAETYTDGAGPAIVSAVTADVAGISGEIDQITVTFSEDIDGATLDTDAGPGSDDFAVIGYSISSVASGGSNVAVITLTESGTPDTDATPQVDLIAGAIEDLAAGNNSIGATQNFTGTTDGAAPVIYSSLLQSSNVFLQVVFSEEIQRVGGGNIVLGDFDQIITLNAGNNPTTLNFDDLTTLAGDPVGTSEDTLLFIVNIDPAFGTYGGDDDVGISTNGTTIEDVVSIGLAGSETAGPYIIQDLTNFPQILSATYTSLSATTGYIELTFSEGLFRDNSNNRSPMLANANNDGTIKNGDYTNGTSLCDEDELCITYTPNGGATIGDNNNSDIEWRTDGGVLLGNNVDYSSDTYRIYFNDLSNGQFRGVESYRFGARNSTQIRGRSTGAYMPDDADYFFDFALPDAYGDDFDDVVSAAAYDVNADGNIDELVVTFPDDVDDATLAASLADFYINGGVNNGVAPSSLVATALNGVDPNVVDDNIFTLGFDSYAGSSVDGTLDFDGTLTFADDAGNLITAGSTTVTDQAGPVVLTATTIDSDLNGNLDSLIIEFSEAFNDIEVSIDDFSVTGYNITSLDDVNSPLIVLSIDSTGGNGFDTYAIPTVSVKGAIIQGQADGADNPDQGIDGSDGGVDPGSPFAATDGAAPYVTVDILGTTSDATPDLSGTVDDPNATVLVSVGANVETAVNNGDGVWTLAGSELNTPLGLGEQQVVLTAFDFSTNIGSDTQIDEVTITGGVIMTGPGAVNICTGAEETLSTITLDESNDTDFSSTGTFILNLPAGFIFNTGASLTIQNTNGSGNVTIGTVEYIGNSSLSIELINDGNDNEDDIITIDGLVVQATGSTARSNDPISIGGDVGMLTGQTSIGDLSSTVSPSPLTDLDETVYTQNNITSFRVQADTTFNLVATPSGQANWYINMFDGTPDLINQTTLDSVDLDPFRYETESLIGLYTLYVVDDDLTCESSPLEFNLLVLDDDDPNTPERDTTFVGDTYVETSAVDTFYVSNPANHTVTVTGAGVTVTNPNSTKILVKFDPAAAGANGTLPQDHTVTYTITNDITGKSESVSIVMTVNPPTEFFLETPENDCFSDLPLSLTLDPTQYGPNTSTDLQFRQFFFYEYMSDGGNYGRYYVSDIDIGTTYPWATTFNVNAGNFDQPLRAIEPGEGSAILIERWTFDPNTSNNIFDYDYIFIYGTPFIELTNVDNNYCDDDGAFTLTRTLRYVDSFTADFPNNEITQWRRNYTTETNTEIVNGYTLERWNGASYDPYEDFTSTGPYGIVNEFDPADPDQDGDTGEDESGQYRIIYTTEDLTPASCSSQTSVVFNVRSPDATPVLDAATRTAASSTGFFNNASPDPGVDADEYVFEYCVDDIVTGFTSVDLNTFNYNNLRTGTITFPAGPIFLNGETVVGQTTAAKAIITSISATSMTLTSLVGDFIPGENIIGQTSGQIGTVTTYSEHFLTTEFITGLTSGATGTITALGDNRFIIGGITGTFLDGEIFQGSVSSDRGQITDLGEITWYDESFNPINGFENSYTIASGAAGLNVNASFRLVAPETVVFYFSTTSIYDCESDLRKVTVNVFEIPGVPNLDISAWPSSVEVGTNYAFDYCVEDDGSSTTPSDLILDDLEPDQSYNISEEFRDFSMGSVNVTNATMTESGGDTNPETINVPDLFAGDTIIYTITKTENISLEPYNNFIGCTGDPITVRIAGHEEAALPSELDFTANTTEFHICEGDGLPNINHTFINGVDEYVWYEAQDGSNNGVTRIGDPLLSGDPMTGTILATAVGNAFDNNTPGVYTYYVARNNDKVDSREFDGCESETIPVTITVHQIQPAPSIVSDNTANGSPDFVDQDPNMSDDIYNFAICSDQIFADMTFLAQDLFNTVNAFSTGEEQVEWYRQSDGFLLYIGEQPDFQDLQLVGFSSGQITFEVIQVTDTLTDSYGNFFEGCEGASATLIIDVSDPESLEITDEVGTPISTVFCYDSDPLGDMSGSFNAALEVASVLVDTTGVDFELDSYLESTYLAMGAPEVDRGLETDSLPTFNIQALHDLVAGSQQVGGEATVHVLTFSYFDDNTLCQSSISTAITIYPRPNVSFTLDDVNVDGLEFCYDDPIISISGFDLESGVEIATNDGTGSFSINTGGLQNTGNNRAEFTPRTAHDNFHGGASPTTPFAAQSTHIISYNYTDPTGCVRDTSLVVFVNPRPEILTGDIQAANSCATDNIELFVDMPDAESNYTYLWVVDTDTIDNTTSERTDLDGNPNDDVLIYDLDGNSAKFSVRVTDNLTGCVATRIQQEITVGEAPDPSVSWAGITEGRQTTFRIEQDNGALSNVNVDSIGLSVDGAQILSDESNPFTFPYDFNYTFSTSGTYTLIVGMKTTAGCRISDTTQISIIDHLPSLTSYTEDFESGSGGWTIETLSLDGKNNTLITSWEIGTNVPDSTSGLTYDGSTAVYTNGYQASEVSFVYSPSFDLSAFDAPTISFLRYEEFETFRDGVVFQMSVDDGRTWVNVGGFDDSQPEGLKSTPNWYNREAITSAPGTVSPGSLSTANNSQGIGWAEDSDWKEAIAPLAIPTGQEQYVRFRFALAAQATPKTTSGFAFDRVQIYEREQVVLIEQFSSTLNELSYDVNKIIDNAPIYNGNDVLRINYFTDFANSGQNMDVINQRNTSAPGARSSYYGIEDIPSISISGDAQLISNASQLAGSVAAQLTNAKLVNPGFDIAINASIDVENILTVGADFTAISQLTGAKLGLFLAILEPEIVVDNTIGPIGLYQIDDTITNVLRKMLPSAAGKFVQDTIDNVMEVNDVFSIADMTWPISNMYVMDTLTIVAYVQNLNTKQVLQSTVLGLSNPNTELALGLEDLADFSLYPNPADKEVTVAFADALRDKTEWVIFDQAGREVLKGVLDKGTKMMTVQTSEMPSGLYFIHLFAEDRKRQSKRIMVIH